MITCHQKYLKARCKQRGYNLDDVMSCVIKQDGDMWTIDETHEAYPKHTKQQMKLSTVASDEELARRQTICAKCKHLCKTKYNQIYCGLHGGNCIKRALGQYQNALIRGESWCESWNVSDMTPTNNYAPAASRSQSPRVEIKQDPTELARAIAEVETVEPQASKQPDARLSAIITAYGQHDLVVAHALACQRSSRVPDEIIVVNDGGDPGLLADLLKQEWTTRVVYARITEDIPWNQAGARNLGIWLSAGDVLAIEDADHIPTRQLYEEALRYLERTPTTASVKPRRIPIRLADLPKLSALKGGKLEHTGSATVIVRRDAICAAKGYDEDYAGHYGCDDTDSRERIARVGRCHATFSPGYFHVTDGSTIGLVKGKPKDLTNYRLRQKKRREKRGVGPLLRFGYRVTTLPIAAPQLRITAIMPARQEGDQVRLTCESFLAAGVDEIIVIDDGSTDGSCDKLPEGVKVIRNEKSVGVGRARNQGAAAATGNVLIFCPSSAGSRGDSLRGGEATRQRIDRARTKR